jgi:AcrR family transcriptional regulator
MTDTKLSSREKVVRSALSLFSSQGITATTTKQIAEAAGVNEVTLFRQFGSKQGLLLAVIKEAPVLERMQAALTDIVGANDPLIAYGTSGLDLLAQVPELVRSLIGEAGQSPPENLQALAQAMQQANQQTVAYLLGAGLNLPSGLSIEAAAGLLNTLILGRAVLEATSKGHRLWQSQSDFLRAIEVLFLSGRPAALPVDSPVTSLAAFSVDSVDEAVAVPVASVLGEQMGLEADLPVADLPAEGVRLLFQKAKKLGAQEYALAYVLFGAGLRLEEVSRLLRSHSLSSKTQHLLTIAGDVPRQVPLNRWIMGARYGTYLKNPLTQWLRARQGNQPAIFVNSVGEPLSVTEIRELWKTIVSETEVAIGEPIEPFRARQTWCIELLLKGMSLENLSILSGLSLPDLAAYARRAREKTALEQALSIDQRGS